MKGDQRMPPKGSEAKTHEWKPKYAVGYDEAKKKRATVPRFNTQKAKE